MTEAYITMPIEKLAQKSNVALEICSNEHDLYWKMAIEVLEVIKENNQQNRDTLMIIPYGPVGPYAVMAYLVNRERISLKRCIFINMDEYLDSDKKYLDKSDPLSFRGGMERSFYNLIDPELNVLPENRIFPEPGNEGNIDSIIHQKGRLDMCWGGIGITGHIAFNEPPEPGVEMSDEAFLKLPTRILKIARETRTINAYMNAGANLDAIPENCITVGMREIWKAKKVRMCMPRDWNAAMLRKLLGGPISCHVPCSLFQNHPDVKVYAIVEATEPPIPQIRVFNKTR